MTVQANKPFSGSQWSEVESLPASDARRVQDEALQEQVAYLAARSKFYQAKFAEHGVDPGAVQSVAAEGMHFLSPDLMVAELIDPETGERVAPVEGARGELVYTALRRQASPLLRFRTRDHVVVTGTSCSCGRTGYKVRCVGRTDDMLIVRGINLFPSAVQDLVLGLRPAATDEMRIRVDFEGHSTQQPLPLVVEHAADLEAGRRDELRRTVEGVVRSALNVKTVVELVPEGTLKRPDHVKVALIERANG